jgi:hypothetical protein
MNKVDDWRNKPEGLSKGLGLTLNSNPLNNER